VRGISDNPVRPILVYSDRSGEVYMPRDYIDYNFFRTRYLQNGNFNAKLYIRLQNGSGQKQSVNELRNAMRKRSFSSFGGDAELLAYIIYSVFFNMQNKTVEFGDKMIFIDRAGDLIGVARNEGKASLAQEAFLSAIAIRISKILKEAKTSPEYASKLKELRKRDGIAIDASRSRPGYNTYSNMRFGYQIDYPEEFVSMAPPKDGSVSNLPPKDRPDKFLFVSPDKKTFLMLVGGNNRGTTLMECYNDNKEGTVKDGEIIRYTIKDKWFSMTWRKNIRGIVYTSYSKMFVGIGEGSAQGFMFSYPEQDKDKYVSVLENLEKSFRPGNIDRAW
jgi:hypothetical protein